MPNVKQVVENKGLLTSYHDQLFLLQLLLILNCNLQFVFITFGVFINCNNLQNRSE